MNPLKPVGRTVRTHPRWSGLGLAVVLAAVGVGSYLVVSDGGSTPAAAQTTTTTQTVATGTIRQSVSASGTLAPAVDDTLSFSSSGVVTSVLVTEGQTVAVGQALATIDSASLAATVAEDKATVASDQAKVSTDETDDVTAAQLAADEAAVTAAQNQLTSAQTALTGATLTSPIAGVVATVGLTVGESVSGSSSGGGGSTTGGGATSTSTASTTGIQVISTDSWVVNATVDATSVGLIKAADQAQLTITGATGTVYGTISTVAVLSSSTGSTASYPVVIAVTGSPAGLHDGEAVTAALIYKQLTDVLVVPTTALHRSTSGGEYVNKIVNGKTVQTTVQVGIASGAETQITSGLAAGDTIQIQTLRPGTGTTQGGTTRGGTGTGTGTGGFGGGTGTGGGFGGGTGTGGFGGGAPGGTGG
jgi:macrolide-specific efflux system membrane fusion protein